MNKKIKFILLGFMVLFLLIVTNLFTYIYMQEKYCGVLEMKNMATCYSVNSFEKIIVTPYEIPQDMTDGTREIPLNRPDLFPELKIEDGYVTYPAKVMLQFEYEMLNY